MVGEEFADLCELDNLKVSDDNIIVPLCQPHPDISPMIRASTC